MLTPETDGNYYHSVQSGETLSWIAGLYEVPLADLMSWNGLDNTSIIRTDQKLILRIAPPATPTLTPAPATTTPSPQPSITQPPPTTTPTATAVETPTSDFNFGIFLGVIVIVIGIGGALWWTISRRI